MQFIMLSNMNCRDTSAQVVNTKSLAGALSFEVEELLEFFLPWHCGASQFRFGCRLLANWVNVFRSLFYACFAHRDAIFFSRNFGNIILPYFFGRRVIYEIHTPRSFSSVRIGLLRAKPCRDNLRIVFVAQGLLDSVDIPQVFRPNLFVIHNGYERNVECVPVSSSLKEFSGWVSNVKKSDSTAKILVHFGSVRKFDRSEFQAFLQAVAQDYYVALVGVADRSWQVTSRVKCFQPVSRDSLENISRLTDAFLFYSDARAEPESYCPLKLIEYLFYENDIIVVQSPAARELLAEMTYTEAELVEDSGALKYSVRRGMFRNSDVATTKFDLRTRARRLVSLFEAV